MDAPFKLAIRNEGNRGIFVYIEATNMMDDMRTCIMSFHPQFANTPGMERLVREFVKESSKLFLECVTEAPGSIVSMEEHEPPKAN